MRKFILMLVLLSGNLSWGQTSENPSIVSPGPGKTLPSNSKVTPPPDLTGLRERASFVASQIMEQSKDLVTFLAILALIITGYHAQFRGLEEFVSTILRIVLAFSLLSSFKEIIPYFFDARKDLLSSLPISGGDVFNHIGLMIGTIGLGTFLMGPMGIGLAVATLLAMFAVLVVYSAQILFEAILVAIAPLAIACIASKHTSGIFAAWFKTFIAVLLIPVGWTIAILFGNNVYGWNGQSVVENSTDLVASIIYTAAMGAIYMGMPILTTWLVNRASGSMAAAMPSPLQFLSSYISGRSMASGGGIGRTTTSSHSPFSTSSNSMGSSSSYSANHSSSGISGEYGERVRAAQIHHVKTI